MLISIEAYVLLTKEVMNRTLDCNILNTSGTADAEELQIIKELMIILKETKVHDSTSRDT